jgi:aminoglycoside/choline kinase family phosphotransferase
MKAVNSRSHAMTAFLSSSGWGAAERRPLADDASTRHYIRLHMGSRTAMLMDQPGVAEAPTAPPDATPEDRRVLGYNALARLAGADCARFVAASRYLRGCGLAAPDIYAADMAQGFLLLEDLGVALYTDILADGGDERTLYEAAIDGLVRLHAERAPAMLAPDKPLFAYGGAALAGWTLPSRNFPCGPRYPVTGDHRYRKHARSTARRRRRHARLRAP